MMRKPIVAGRFYPSDFSGLDHEIRRCFEGKYGPGCTPGKRKDSKIRGIIVPHAGFVYSGSCAAWGYKEIAESRFPDCFIILGLSHEGYRSSISSEDWVTPFGTVKNDSSFGKRISKEAGIPVNDASHRNEHSIEVQLPFLQFSCRDRLRDIRIVPINVSGDIDPIAFGNAIKKTSEGKDVVIITSSDFTHFGASYGYEPFTEDIKNKLESLDKGAIDLILERDLEGFRKYIEKTGATICGRHPISSMISCMRDGKGRLLRYYSSADISGSEDMSVGYAAISFA